MRRTLGAALCMAALLAGCGGPRGLYWPVIPPDLPLPRVVDESLHGATIDIQRTQLLRVRLPADGGDAYRWSYELGKDRMLYPAGETPQLEAAGTTTPGNVTFQFRAEGVGTTSVRFVYRNPELPEAAPIRTLAFDVVAR